jgi:AcrR family transcriptional regulator
MATPAKVLRAATRATSRRAQYSASTRNALVKSAVKLFAEQGYAGTSLDEVVARARVTKGALYHHYQGKQALFEAVFDQVEDKAKATIAKRVRKARDPWQRAIEGLRGYLEVCQDPTYRRIVIQEGPVRLGFDRWREAEERSTYGLVAEIVRGLMNGIEASESIVETFAQVFFGAMGRAGIWVADSDDPEQASRDVEAVISAFLGGLRGLVESGVNIFDPQQAVRPDSTSEDAD